MSVLLAVVVQEKVVPGMSAVRLISAVLCVEQISCVRSVFVIIGFGKISISFVNVSASQEPCTVKETV